MRTFKQLVDGYYKLRRESALRDFGARFEGLPWDAEIADGKPTAVRHADGWELRVYEIEGDVEACLIDPEGKTRTYS
jgi:hypothetical protein